MDEQKSNQKKKRLAQFVSNLIPRLSKIKRVLNKSIIPVAPTKEEEKKEVKDQDYFSFLKDIPVYCICLEEHEDRYQHCQEEFKKVGLDQYVQYYRPKRHPEGGLKGCHSSHDFILHKIYESNAPYGVVFEDDPVFIPKWKEQVLYIKIFLEKEPDWHFLRLGSFFVQSYEDRSKSCPDHIARMATLTTHAYIVSRPFVEAWVQRATYQGRGVDCDFLLYSTKNYALLDSMVWQSGKFNSSIEWGEKGSLAYNFQKFVQKSVNYEIWQKQNNKFILLLSHIPKEIRPSISLIETQSGVKLPSTTKPALLL